MTGHDPYNKSTPEQDGSQARRGLKGQLEDIPLVEILQIVAFSKKTGYLRIEAPLGRAALVLKDGLILCAYSWSTIGAFKQLGTGGPVDPKLLRQHIEISLQEISGLREGTFLFQLADTIGNELDGVDISPFIEFPGVDPQHLLLDLARDMDEERRNATELIRAPEKVIASDKPEPEPEVPAQRDGTEILLVDDEEMVTRVVSAELDARGYHVHCASAPLEGFKRAEELVQSGTRSLLVTDFRMPTSTGGSFNGGFELVRRLRRAGLRLPILLMTERLSEKARAKAIELGINRVVFKPSVSKLDLEDYEADLRSFASLLAKQITKMTEHPRLSAENDSDGSGGSLLLEFLSSMTEQLVNPEHALDVPKIVLNVGAKYFERGALFLIQDGRALGLGGFGLAATDDGSTEFAKKLVIQLEEARPIAMVVESRSPVRVNAKAEGLERTLYAALGRGHAREAILLPLLNNRDVIAVLFGDNPISGRPVGSLQGVQMFLGQAGMALENVFLHRKLKVFESKLARPAQIQRETG